MKTAIFSNRSMIVSGASALLAMAAMAFSSAADARGDVSFSVGIGLPGVQIGVDNAYPVYGGYPQPVYAQPQPVYVQPQPVYVQPATVYVQPQPVFRPRPIYVQPAPVYAVPAPIYYSRPGWDGHRRHGHGRGYERGYDRSDREDDDRGRGGRGYSGNSGYSGYSGYSQPRGYGPVYYQR